MKKNKPELTGGGDRKERYSNLELLRIFTMLCIIAHHYVVNSGITDKITPANTLQWNSLSALIFGWGGKTGINCFVLITGYFMCKSRINVKKFLEIFLEIEFYEIIFYVVFVCAGYEPFSLKIFIKTVCLPIYDIGHGFCGSYLVFFLFIPYLNLLIKNMDEKQHLYLIVLCLLVGTVFQTFLKAPSAFTYIGWFIVLYFIASYIRMFSDKEYDNRWFPQDIFDRNKIWGYAAIFSLLLSWCSVIAGAVAYHLIDKDLAYYFVADSNKLLAVITSICVFIFFKNLRIGQNKIVNTVAKSTFGVLLIHANSDIMRRWLWRDLLDNVHAYQIGADDICYFMIHVSGSVIIVYCVCTMIDMIRIRAFSFVKKLGYTYIYRYKE